MIRMAVTGGFCSGKSRVARFLGERGCPVIDCDRIVGDELYRDRLIAERACDILGAAAIDAETGRVDSETIWRIFSLDRERKRRLEEFIHPLVFERLERWFGRVSGEGAHPIAVAEVQLLNADMELFDVVALTVCHHEVMIDRAGFRAYTPELAGGISGMQPDWRERAALADFVIWNNGTLSQLQRRTDEIYDALALKKAVAG